MELWNTAGTSDCTVSPFMCTLGNEACIDFHKEFVSFGVAFETFMPRHSLALEEHEKTDTLPRHGR